MMQVLEVMKLVEHKILPKHSNFIVNNGYASAKDIHDLIFYVQKTVQEKYGVLLKPEVRFINWES